MASSLASDKPSLPVPTGDGGSDPFLSPGATTPAINHNNNHRYSAFDQDLFDAGPGSSPRQAKMALEAHLAETDRRLDEAGKLGTALVSQRKALAEQLQEIEKLQSEGEMGPELREKLVVIEKEYNDLARESARAFLPKQRVPSNETNPGSPFAPEGRGGRRSVSPSKFEKFESHGSGSPMKLAVPNRKIRNQPSTRVHDIEFAAEISTSLIAQVRNLQQLLAERDEEVKDLKASNSTFEVETENLQQRLKALDESENRYKEANWELETRIQDLNTAQKEQADREKKLNQTLEAATAAKATTQKELDEVKLAHAKLAEEHTAAVKHHDIELGTTKRNLFMADAERTTMQRKINELTSQNTELAKAFSMQRSRSEGRDPTGGSSPEGFESAADAITPEESPPQSPMKGTPRHSMLETETMKTSLSHAQRTIQSQRSQIHREKTEKLELRRIIQDLRDDLDRTKSEMTAPTSTRRSRKTEPKEVKKNKALLGSLRASRQEILPDDPDWEDTYTLSPRSVSSPQISPTMRQAGDRSFPTDSSEQFETANEASESAFETANERGTETEDFQTVNEEMPDSDDDGAETETELTSRGFGRLRRPPSLPAGGHRTSYDSTASTSADEDDMPESLKTPNASHSSLRNRSRVSRGPFGRTSRQASEEPNLASSPASFIASASSTPKVGGGQSLFAELQEFGSDNDSLGAITPSQRSVRSVTPGSIRRRLSPAPAMPAMPKVIMVDSGMMTDDVKFQPDVTVDVPQPDTEHVERAGEADAVANDNRASRLTVGSEGTTRPWSIGSYSDAGAQHDVDMERKLAMFPVPPTTPPKMDSLELSLATVQAEHVEPREEIRPPPPTPPTLTFTPVVNERVEPGADHAIAAPALSFSSVSTEIDVVPVAYEMPRPALSMTNLLTEVVVPGSDIAVAAPGLSLGGHVSESVEPGSDPTMPAPDLSISSIFAEHDVAPSNLEIPRAKLSMASLISQSIEPTPEAVAALETEVMAVPVPVPTAPEAPELGFSSMMSEHIEPVHEEEKTRSHDALAYSGLAMHNVEPVQEQANERAHNALGFSSVTMEHIEPVREADVSRAHEPLVYSLLSSENVEPVAEKDSTRAHEPLAFSTLSIQNVEPIAAKEAPAPTFALSPIAAHNINPIVREAPRPPMLALSQVSSENVEPLTWPEDTLSPSFAFSAIGSVDTRPITPRSPWRDGFILPRDAEPLDLQPETPKKKGLGLLGFGKKSDSPTLIAEDETRQSPSDTPQSETPESQRPFKEISTNSDARPQRKAAVLDQGAQTSLTADAIDKLFQAGSRPTLSHEKKPSVSSIGTMASAGTVRINRPLQQQDSFGSPLRNTARGVDDTISETGSVVRPSSAASGRQSTQEAPPLPNNHRELIEAARTGSSSGNMGPPLWPASALKNRPHTPSGHGRPMSNQSGRGTPTPRAARSGSAMGSSETQHHARFATRSRQSSVSSFTSEIENRFNMRPGEMGLSGFGPNTDPRMIQAITQTMIGEYLWKYTRKTGRGEMSEKRHRRYFWVHPYTRALHWSDGDPSTSGRAESRSKSVPIEAVRVVTDDNPMPPGLHRKSLIVVAPGRTIKFTCTTGQRHETWFNALSYLLLRTNDPAADAEDVAAGITGEDVDEFNPPLHQQPSNGTRPRMAPSLSSYNSRGTRNESPAPNPDMMEIPTLTPSRASTRGALTPDYFRRSHSSQSHSRPQMGTLGRISGYWKGTSSGGPKKLSGTFSSMRGRGPSSGAVAGSAQSAGIYEASEVHDSAEDLREMIERQDRESDRLENVRACCDGKHDVGSLHHHTTRQRGTSTHGHPTPTGTPLASFRSRS